MAIGRKGRDFFRNRRATIAGEYIGLTGKGRVEFSEALEVARDDHQAITPKTRASIKSSSSTTNSSRCFQQRVVLEQLLPVARAAPGRGTGSEAADSR